MFKQWLKSAMARLFPLAYAKTLESLLKARNQELAQTRFLLELQETSAANWKWLLDRHLENHKILKNMNNYMQPEDWRFYNDAFNLESNWLEGEDYEA